MGTDSTLTRKAFKQKRSASDRLFMVLIGAVGLSYVVLILLLVGADVAYLVQSHLASGSSSWLDNPIVAALRKPEIRYSLGLTLFSCTVAAVLALWVAVPLGYLLTRSRLPARNLIDAILDIPIVLPPLVVGLSLLILFQMAPLTTPLGRLLPFSTPWDHVTLNHLVVYQVPAVILAQFVVAAAFAVRTMKATFEHLDPRSEQVALTLGCTRFQAFRYVVLPEAGKGMLTALVLAWARALGEFGPLLVFAGATRNKTEVLSTTVFLELSIGDLEAAVAVSLIMIVCAMLVVFIARLWGSREMTL